MGQYLKATPLLAFVLALYFVTVFIVPGALDRVLFSGVVPSGATWTLKAADLIIALGLLVLFFELVKATRSTVASMIDQILSMLLFTGCIVLFLLVQAAGTATFFLLTIMSFVDVLATFIITVSVTRRDITVERQF